MAVADGLVGRFGGQNERVLVARKSRKAHAAFTLRASKDNGTDAQQAHNPPTKYGNQP